MATSLAMVDELDERIDECGVSSPARCQPPLHPAAVVRSRRGPALAYTIASEIGDIARFASPKKLTGTPACARSCAHRATATSADRGQERA